MKPNRNQPKTSVAKQTSERSNCQCECPPHAIKRVALKNSVLECESVKLTELIFENLFKAKNPVSSKVSAPYYNQLDLKNKTMISTHLGLTCDFTLKLGFVFLFVAEVGISL